MLNSGQSGLETESKVIHVDMDAFYASVEQRDDPNLRGKTVAVGGAPSGRGVVVAASYEARKFGVRSAMSSATAKRLCPKIIFVRPRFSEYQKASTQVRECIREVSSVFEPLSLDEAFLDVSLLSWEEAIESGKKLKKRIFEKTQLVSSVGIGPNKFIAKALNNVHKPNSMAVILPQDAFGFAQKLKVTEFWGVGPATARRLTQRGLFWGRDLTQFGMEGLEDLLGKYGRFLYQLSIGKDSRKIGRSYSAKSCGAERTFSQDIENLEQLERKLWELVEKVVRRLGEKKIRTLTVKLRRSDFLTRTCSKTLSEYTNDLSLIGGEAILLLRNQRNVESWPLRLIGITLKGFEGEVRRAVSVQGDQLTFEWYR